MTQSRDPYDRPTPEGEDPRRVRLRRRVRLQRQVAVAGSLVIIGVASALAFRSNQGRTLSAPVQKTETQATSKTLATVVNDTPTNERARAPRAAPEGRSAEGAPQIIQDPIPYSAERKRQMAEYSRIHYGISSAALDPKVIVLHFTESTSYKPVWGAFAANTPAPGPAGTKAVPPGTCSHFAIDQDGTVYQLVPLTLQCRHTIGLNRWAIGIEMVQATQGHDSAWADRQILNRPRQVNAALRLVRRLQGKYGIPADSVVGHATANRHPRFLDLAGWKNDHSDWQATDVIEFRRHL